MAKFTGGAVPLIVRPHDISTLSGLLHHINISYNGTQSCTVQAVGAQAHLRVLQSAHIWLIKAVRFMGLFLDVILEHVKKCCILEKQQFD